MTAFQALSVCSQWVIYCYDNYLHSICYNNRVKTVSNWTLQILARFNVSYNKSRNSIIINLSRILETHSVPYYFLMQHAIGTGYLYLFYNILDSVSLRINKIFWHKKSWSCCSLKSSSGFLLPRKCLSKEVKTIIVRKSMQFCRPWLWLIMLWQ